MYLDVAVRDHKLARIPKMNLVAKTSTLKNWRAHLLLLPLFLLNRVFSSNNSSGGEHQQGIVQP